jgi:RNA polymerase sigma-70 factor (ECF subfamily)
LDETHFASTNLLLLDRLRDMPRDEEAWSEFVLGYAPAIRRWCRTWGLQAVDSDDVTQTVLCKLARKMTTFHYDRSRTFRGYLKTLTYYAVCDALEEIRRRKDRPASTTLLDWLVIVDTRNDLARCLETELRRDLFREAAARVMRRTEPGTWDAFRLLSLERLPGQDVARRLGMTVAAVYMAKSRVVKMLRQEIRGLSRMMTDTAEE